MISDVRLLAAQAWRLSRRGVSVALVALLANGLLGGASLLLLIPIVNSISDSSVAISIPMFGDLPLSSVPLGVLLGLFVVLIGLQSLIAVASATSTLRVQQLLVDRLRYEAFAAVLAARWSFIVGRRRSDIVSVITLGSVRAGMAYNQLLQFCVAAVITVVTAVIALLVSPWVAAIAIAGVLMIALVQSFSVRPAHRLGVELGDRQRTMQAVVTDSLDSLRMVRAHSASALWNERLASAFTELREVQVSNTRRQSAVSGLAAVATAIGASILVLVAAALDAPPATIVIVLLLAFRLSVSARQLVSASALMANSLPAARDLADLTDEAVRQIEVPEQTGTLHRVDVQRSANIVELRGVTYTYPGSDNGLIDASLAVPSGSITALVGPSGAGKSTVVDLVLGLLRPEAGEVLVNGEALRTSELDWWRSLMGYVPQETVLIPGTLRDNLAWSVGGDCTDEDCWRALDQASAVFARSLPAGLDTELGDRGVRLSGGERQRIAIARALLRRPSLLVLDEPTSSLDDQTEREVLDLIRSLTPAVTVLVVAHRRTTIEAADQVIRIEDGRVLQI